MEQNENIFDENIPSTCPIYTETGTAGYNQESNSNVSEQQANYSLVACNNNNNNNNINNNNDYNSSIQLSFAPKNCSSTTDMCLLYPPTSTNNQHEFSGGYEWYPLPCSDPTDSACASIQERPERNIEHNMASSSYPMSCQLLSTLDTCTLCYQTNPWTQSSSMNLGTPSSHLAGSGCTKCQTGNTADTSPYSNSGREARNRAEKNRRDRLNGCIQELSTLVPHVAESTRRVDKIAVLRFATHGLRLKHVFGKSTHCGSPYVTNSVMKLLDSFFLTLTCNGQIVLVSSNVEEYLGHAQSDLYGQNILNITHPEDRDIIKRQLIPTDMDSLFNVTQRRILLEDNKSQRFEDESSMIKDEERQIENRLRKDKRSFVVRLARAGPRSEPIAYELVLIRGSFRRSDMAPKNINKRYISSMSAHLSRRSRNLYTNEDTYIMPLQTISGNDVELIAVARILRSATLYRTVNLSQLEYKTRHLIDGRIVDCDQRISIVAGYMKDEVRNLSPFTFIHRDDVKWVIVALRQMYDCRSSYGESTYRLLTRSGEVIYLHTKGFLDMNNATNQLQSFVCVNTLLNASEGQKLLMDMKRKYSVIINTKLPQLRENMNSIDNFQPSQQQQQQQHQQQIQDLKPLPNLFDTIGNVSATTKTITTTTTTTTTAVVTNTTTTATTLDTVDDGSEHFDIFLKCFDEIPKILTEENALFNSKPTTLNEVASTQENYDQEYQGKIITQYHYVSSTSDAFLADSRTSLTQSDQTFIKDELPVLMQELRNDQTT